MSRSLHLQNRIALVTGGAQGLGLEIARTLLIQGATVAVFDLDSAKIDAAVVELSIDHPEKVIGRACDVRDKEQVERLVGEIDQRFGRLDILVNNAGIHRRGTPLNYSEQDIEDVFAVNMIGCYHMAGAAGRLMIRESKGSIINVAALGGGLMGLGRGGSIYGMSKGGIVALTRDLAAEWGKYSVRVNAVAPGWIRTDMTRALQADPLRSGRVLERVPLRRWGEAEDVAGVVAFLASDAAAYVTGCTIPVDGGAANVIALSDE